jgi:hypothetical protein
MGVIETVSTVSEKVDLEIEIESERSLQNQTENIIQRNGSGCEDNGSLMPLPIPRAVVDTDEIGS